MEITANSAEGTIGGGALEYRVIATARRILARGGEGYSETIPLGPALGQCCGGAVTLRYTYTPLLPDAAPASAALYVPTLAAPLPLWLWGAGHVGRAVVTAAPTQVFDITWIDSTADRFPADMSADVTATPATDMPLLATRAPLNAHHLIFTYSHEIDLALCAALLRRGAASIGLIGSQTKWARFSKRLRDMGHDPAAITCPIGNKTLGKAPSEIAHGTVQSLLAASQDKVSA